MQLRWTEAAATDLERIAEHLLAHVPDRAPGLVRSIYEAPEMLLAFPHRGRPGKRAGTRELVPSPLPRIVVYAVSEKSSTSSASCMARNVGPDGRRLDIRRKARMNGLHRRRRRSEFAYESCTSNQGFCGFW